MTVFTFVPPTASRASLKHAKFSDGSAPLSIAAVPQSITIGANPETHTKFWLSIH